MLWRDSASRSRLSGTLTWLPIAARACGNNVIDGTLLMTGGYVLWTRVVAGAALAYHHRRRIRIPEPGASRPAAGVHIRKEVLANIAGGDLANERA
jgi:hypothetical protein